MNSFMLGADSIFNHSMTTPTRPELAPGFYTVTANTGSYPDDVDDSDAFIVEVVAP